MRIASFALAGLLATAAAPASAGTFCEDIGRIVGALPHGLNALKISGTLNGGKTYGYASWNGSVSLAFGNQTGSCQVVERWKPDEIHYECSFERDRDDSSSAPDVLAGQVAQCPGATAVHADPNGFDFDSELPGAAVSVRFHGALRDTILLRIDSR
jgi:hypothetical protein